MAAPTWVVKSGDKIRQRKAVKASGTVIAPGDLVTLASGLIVKAGATDTAIALCQNGAASGVTDVEVTEGNDFTMVGPSTNVFAVAQRGVSYDIDAAQKINSSGTTYKVLKMGISADSGTVGGSVVEAKIALPLF